MTDKKLLNELKKDRDKGLGQLIDTYSGYVYKIVASVILSVGTKEDAEECTSDVFLTLYSHIDEIDLSKGSIKGYIGVIAKRKAIDLYRKLERHSNNLCDDEAEAVEDSKSLSYEDKQLLYQSVKDLGEPDTTIVTRRYFFGESAKEIAEALGNISEKAVQKRLERSIKKLRTVLGGVYGE